jgi:hypothetical protein
MQDQAGRILTIDDIVALSPQDATQASAMDYAGRSLHFTYNRMQYGDAAKRLIRITVGVMIEMAFESFLVKAGKLFDKRGRTHWREKDQAEFHIHGQKTDVKGYHVYPSNERQFPHWILACEALVPVDQLHRHDAPDIYCQAFLVASQRNTSAQHRYVAVLPADWCNVWHHATPIHIGMLEAQAESLHVHLCGELMVDAGQVPQQVDVSEALSVGAGAPVAATAAAFCSLQYIWTDQMPAAPMQVAAGPSRRHIIQAHEWHDLWLDHPKVYLAGWQDKKAFSQATILEAGSRTHVYTGGTRTRNHCLPIRALHPIASL